MSSSPVLPLQVILSATPRQASMHEVYEVAPPHQHHQHHPHHQALNQQTLDGFATHLSMHLAGDYLQLGSVIGHTLGSSTPETNATIITHLLAAGFAYVCAPGGKVSELGWVRRGGLGRGRVK